MSSASICVGSTIAAVRDPASVLPTYDDHLDFRNRRDRLQAIGISCGEYPQLDLSTNALSDTALHFAALKPRVFMTDQTFNGVAITAPAPNMVVRSYNVTVILLVVWLISTTVESSRISRPGASFTSNSLSCKYTFRPRCLWISQLRLEIADPTEPDQDRRESADLRLLGRRPKCGYQFSSWTEGLPEPHPCHWQQPRPSN